MTVNTIVLRDGTEDDVSALVRLLRRSWLVSWAPELPFEAVQAFAKADPARLYTEAMWSHFLVATLDGALVGMVQTLEDQVESLHIDPDVWNRGIGSKLLNAAECRIARLYPLARLEVRAFNKRACAFYKRHGWVEMRRYPGMECGSPVESIEMQKAL